MLSDCVGCDSVYRYGYANPVDWDKKSTYWKEAKLLGVLADTLHEEYGPFSISYGYISPQLSRNIVKYMNPDVPSYHRWDDGAAMDFCFHNWKGAPVQLSHEVDDYYDYSRMITYSESPWICIATKVAEQIAGVSRKAFYENRYEGEKKPRFVKYSEKQATRASQKAAHELSHDWRGQGYPSYHGGGREQYHHHRVGKVSFLSDFLYDAKLVHEGGKNTLPLSGKPAYKKIMTTARDTASVITRVTQSTGRRVSVVKAYRQGKWPYTEIVPAHGVDADDVADLICGMDYRAEVRKTVSGIKRVRFYV
jgi:hypothetical protein